MPIWLWPNVKNEASVKIPLPLKTWAVYMITKYNLIYIYSNLSKVRFQKNLSKFPQRKLCLLINLFLYIPVVLLFNFPRAFLAWAITIHYQKIVVPKLRLQTQGKLKIKAHLVDNVERSKRWFNVVPSENKKNKPSYVIYICSYVTYLKLRK